MVRTTDEFHLRIDAIQEAIGRIEARQLNSLANGSVSANEFRAFSQWGEDGIIQFLIRHVDIQTRTFVEFGVGDYREANTRFLLVNNRWSGLLFDSDRYSLEKLRRTPISWRQGLQIVNATITTDNINQLLTENGYVGEIGLLSIDVDGNDYWIWRAIEVINPVIVICEYNHRFGSEAAVTIPYDESFERGRNHPLVYFGASLSALCLLAREKGYAFVGCNSDGVNAFFIRRDRLPADLAETSAADGFVPGKFTEIRDEGGLPIPETKELREHLFDLPLVDVSA
jgi:hypothetical protein